MSVFTTGSTSETSTYPLAERPLATTHWLPPRGADALHQEAFRLKRSTYRVGLAFGAVATLYPVILSWLGTSGFTLLHLLTNVPIAALLAAAAFATRSPAHIRFVECILLCVCVGHVLVWDVINLVNMRPPVLVLGATEPLVISATLLMAVVLSPRRASWSAWLFFLAHGGLSWANLARFPWSVTLTNHIISDIITAGTIAGTSLLSTYQRIMGASKHEGEVLRAVAHTDVLTGLPNRRGLLAFMTNHAPCLYLMADVDDFKAINDTFGHDAADKVLIGVGEALARATPPGGLVGRWGGEEFLAVVPGTDAAIVGRWFAQVQAALMTQPETLGVTLSAGVAAQGQEESAQSALRRADDLMYVAKRDGKNRCVMGTEVPATGLGLSGAEDAPTGQLPCVTITGSAAAEVAAVRDARRAAAYRGGHGDSR